MKYVEDSKLNKKVAKIIEELKEEIVHRFHPESIIISGSFGRGEAVVFEENGKLKFLSDCEVILIPYKWIFSRKKLDEFEQEFYRKTGLKVEISGFTPTLYLTLPFLKNKIKPTIANYDLKYGSKVIYGKNYLDKIPNFKPEDIPLWEGIRLILNRMAEALEHFSPKNPTQEMLFWTDKIVLACQDSLLLLLKEYTPSYRKRNERFLELAEHFEIPCIEMLIKFSIEATKRRLGLSSYSLSANKMIRYWFEVCRVCDEVFRYVLNKGFNIKFKDYTEFQEKYLSSELKNYTTLPFNNVILQNLFRFFKKVVTKNKLPTLKMVLKPIHWDHIIYSLIPLVYFSLSEDFEINSKYLNKAVEVLNYLVGIRNIKDIIINNNNFYSFENWNYIKNIVITCWYQMRL